jgi:hypothetical protein
VELSPDGVSIREFPRGNYPYNEDLRLLALALAITDGDDMKRRFFLFLSALFFKDKIVAAPRPAGGNPAAKADSAKLPRSASYRTARAMLTLPQQEDSWQAYMLKDEHESEFLWTGDGEAVERWNELFAGKHDIGTVHATVEGTKEHFFLEYGGSKLQAPVKHDRDDEMVVVVTLNRLVKEVTEIRFCIDSYHSSDLAFLALPPFEWGALEAEFGAAAVGYRFMPLPDTMAKFWPRLQKTSDEAHARPYHQTA